MTVCSEDFLTSANSFAKSGGEEIDWRNSASRAYYCVWHESATIDELITDHAGSGQSGGMHEQRIRKYTTYPLRSNADDVPEDTARNIRAIGHMLKALRSKRVQADYKIDLEFLESSAKTAISDAQRLVEKSREITLQLQKLKGGQSESAYNLP